MYFVQIVRDEVKRHPTSHYPVVVAVLTLPPSTQPSSTAARSKKQPTRSQFGDRGVNRSWSPFCALPSASIIPSSSQPLGPRRDRTASYSSATRLYL